VPLCIALMRGCVMGVRYFKGGRGSFGSAVLRYAAVLTVSVGATLWSGSILWDAVIGAPFDRERARDASPTNAPSTASAVLEGGDDWMQNLRSEKFWASNKSGGSNKSAKSESRASSGPDFSQRSGLIKSSVPTPSSETKFPSKSLSKAQDSKSESKNERADGSNWYSGNGNHRTVCVRLCDGYFWPVSFSTDSDNFDRDKRVCEKSCGSSQTRLFVHDNPGQDIDQMVDLKGVPYTKLRTAFLFRTSYDQSCKCNAHPWEQASKDRHRIYALEAEKRKGSQHAAAELTRMKSALIEARKTATAVRTASIEPARNGSTRTDVTPGAVGSGKRMARHAPLSGLLTSDEVLDPVALEAAESRLVTAGRLQQWAQMMPTPNLSRPPEPATKLPAPPFALPNNAPPMLTASGQQTASLALPAPSAGSKSATVQRHNLAVTAPPIIARANDELGIKAPLAVNTAQLEQVNAPRKSPVESPKIAQGAPNTPKQKVAVSEPEPRTEPKPQREAKREPRVAVARPSPAPTPRVVERPAPRPAVRVVEAPRPQVARPQQITAVRSDAWRARVFESRAN
jgi:Protein of unknown function (DUF2865)